jgi:hypothetical protein
LISVLTLGAAQGALALFERVINFKDIATGEQDVTGTLGSNGPASATHTETAPPLPSSSGPAYKSWSKSLVASYSMLDNQPPPSATPSTYTA